MASTTTSLDTKFHGLSLHVTIQVAPENVEKFLKAFKPAYELVTAEPECTFFEVFQSQETPGLFRFVEGWSKDLKWFMEVQMKKEYYTPYLEATEHMWIMPRELQFFNRMPFGWLKTKPEHFH